MFQRHRDCSLHRPQQPPGGRRPQHEDGPQPRHPGGPAGGGGGGGGGGVSAFNPLVPGVQRIKSK